MSYLKKHLPPGSNGSSSCSSTVASSNGFALAIIDIRYVNTLQGYRQGGAAAPQFLTDQLTLSQPGGLIMPTTVLPAPPDFQTLRRACPIKMEDYANRLSLSPLDFEMFLRTCFQNIVYHIGVKKK